MPDSSLSLLVGLLCELFDAGDLKRHLASGPDGIDLVHGLPGNAASLKELAYEAVVALARRGLVTAEFFDRLIAERPRRRDAIARVRDAWFAAQQPAPGATWGGRYRLDAPLGDGGFGSVWRAVDTRTGELVALKILHPRHQGDARTRQRFIRGARTLAKLSHPAIVRVLTDIEEVGLHCFYAMEYVRGVTLELCVRERRFPPHDLVAMTLQIGDALAHVHQHGLLHRDVKPTNILVTGRDTARLIDFDLVTGDDHVAVTTQAVGTGLYMPLEAHTTDRKTPAYDVFSLARTVEFVLRGRLPNASELADVTDLPASHAVRVVLRAALAPDPQRRTPDMASFCAALRAALASDRPAPPRPPDPSPPDDIPAPSPAPRYAAMLSIAALVVLVVAAPPPRYAPLILAFLIAPTTRVLLDHPAHRALDVLHWLWIVVCSLLTFILAIALFDSSPAANTGRPHVAAMLVAIALGIYAGITYLRRPRPAPTPGA